MSTNPRVRRQVVGDYRLDVTDFGPNCQSQRRLAAADCVHRAEQYR